MAIKGDGSILRQDCTFVVNDDKPITDESPSALG
jgi:hypothetical protein